MAQPKNRRLATEKYADDAAAAALKSALEAVNSHTHPFSTITEAAEAVQDIVAAMLVGGVYDDATGKYQLPAGGTVPGDGTEPAPAPDPTVAPVFVETYKATAGSGGDDTAALNAAFAAASGKTVKFAAGKTYRHNAQLNVTLDDVTIDFNGATLLATNELNCSLKWTGRRGTLKNFRREGVSTKRGVNYETNILLIDGAHGFTAVDGVSKGSAATGIFITRTRGFTLKRMVVEDSRADGFHITGGSSLGVVEDCTANRPGDDGFAVVSYALLTQSDPGMCSDIEFINPKVRDQTVRGRGFTVVGGTNITYRNVDSDGTWGPGIYIACEPYGDNPTHGVDNVKFLGGTLRRAHLTTTEIKNGSILVASSRAGETIKNVLIQGITTYDTNPSLPYEFGAYGENGGTITGLQLQTLKAINGSRGQLLYTNLASSQYSQSGVTKETTGGGATTPTATTVQITTVAVTNNSASLAWKPVVGTDGVALSGAICCRTGVDSNGTGPWCSTDDPAAGSRTFYNLVPGNTYELSVQPLAAGQPYGPPVKVTIVVPTDSVSTDTITSEGFTGAGEVIGRATDLAVGGQARTWAGSPLGAFTVANGRLTRGTNLVNSFVGLPVGVLDVQLAATLSALPTGDNLILDLHRQSPNIDGLPDTYRLLIAVTGAMRLAKRIGGTDVTLGNAAAAGLAKAGDRFVLRYTGGRLELLRNATLLESVADTSITTPGWAGIAAPNSNTGLTVDDVALSTPPAAQVPGNPNPGGTGFLSGASLDGVSKTSTTAGALYTWRGGTKPLGATATWADNGINTTTNIWAFTVDGWGSFPGLIDVAVGGVYPNEGDTWANAAAGAYDARWRTCLQIIADYRRNKPGLGLTVIRPFHEFNGSWYPWALHNSTEIGHFITAWRRFRALQLQIFPEAKLEWSPNRETSGLSIKSTDAWPGDAYVDIVGVDFYFQWPGYPNQAAWDAHLTATDGTGGPKGWKAWQQFAFAHGKPYAHPEWSTNSEPGDPAGMVDQGAAMTSFLNLCEANQGWGAGQVPYAILFNAAQPNDAYSGRFGLYPYTESPQAAANYKAWHAAR